MRTIALVAACLALAGCQTVLSGIQKCERKYDGTVSGGIIQPAVLAGDAQIKCCPVGTYNTGSGETIQCTPLPPGTPLALGRVIGGPG